MQEKNKSWHDKQLKKTVLISKSKSKKESKKGRTTKGIQEKLFI